jgi:uncharacterized NAD(P)/FAD-binding protein YdhS
VTRMPLREEDGPTRVVVVGGGAAGVITAAHLLRSADAEHGLEVQVVEKSPTAGPGLAYRTTHPRHMVNNYAARLSAVDGDPDHLLRWCDNRGTPVGPMGFVHRSLYGHYLSDVFANIRVPAGSALGRTMGTVTDVRREDGQLAVHLSNGWRIETDKVVLALGNPPPRRIPLLERRGGYVRDPWAPDLLEQVGQAPEVLLLGTGLTMVDVVAQLHDALPMTRFTAVSRHGYLPATHRRSSSRLHDAFHPGTAPLPVLEQRVRSRIEEISEIGGDWRDVIDSVRAAANDLWRGLSPEDQDEFVASVARRWDTARHRMSPYLADLISRLRTSGRLRIATTADVAASAFPVVVNCTGPAPVPTQGWNPLVDTLLGRGAIRPHRLGLGLDLDEHGRVIDEGGAADPDVFAVGAARKGVEWEVVAVPDLRSQAVRLADLLAADREARSATAVTRSGTA